MTTIGIKRCIASALAMAFLLSAVDTYACPPPARSQGAKAAFKHLHPCPANARTYGSCPGYVIDHIKPLACGGKDDPSNMQWQTTAEGKKKDAWERKDCEHGRVR